MTIKLISGVNVINVFKIFFNIQTKNIKSIVHNSIVKISLKTYTLAGFEPGPSVPEADARCDNVCRGHFYDHGINCCLLSA
jgi:hypothetical protein